MWLHVHHFYQSKSVTNATVLGNGSYGDQFNKSIEVNEKEKDQTQIKENDLNYLKTGCKRIILSNITRYQKH